MKFVVQRRLLGEGWSRTGRVPLRNLASPWSGHAVPGFGAYTRPRRKLGVRPRKAGWNRRFRDQSHEPPAAAPAIRRSETETCDQANRYTRFAKSGQRPLVSLPSAENSRRNGSASARRRTGTSSIAFGDKQFLPPQVCDGSLHVGPRCVLCQDRANDHLKAALGRPPVHRAQSLRKIAKILWEQGVSRESCLIRRPCSYASRCRLPRLWGCCDHLEVAILKSHLKIRR